MLKLKIISLLLCLILALQIIPIQQIGKMIGNNQWNEELPHGTGDESNKPDVVPLFEKEFLPACNFTGTNIIIETKAIAYLHYSSQIPSNHAIDVVSPPPDVLV